MGLFSVVLVALLALTGVRSADVELGGTCTSSDNCVHPTLELACSVKDGETVTKCLIKTGQACATGFETYCVAGAECTGSSPVCTCKASVYTEASGICTVAEDKWAGACPSSGTCTAATDNLVCNTGLSKCICADDTAVALATGTCTVAIAADKVGKTCTATSDCGMSTNLECSSTKCVCAAGYTGPIGGGCTAVGSDGLIGRACTSSGTECGTATSTFLACPSSGGLFCACQTGYTGVTGIACYPANGQLNGGCSGTSQGTCSDATMECTGTGAKLCKSKVLGNCTADADCTSTTTMVCDTLASKCLIQVGQSCTDNTANCRTGATCTGTGTTCACDTDISTDSGGVCNPNAGFVGGSCGTCTDSNAECTSSTCSCKTGFTVVPSTLTCTGSKAGAVTASVLMLLLMGVISQLLVSQ